MEVLVARSQGQRASRKQEARIAESVGGRVTSGSGNTDFATQKGDVRKQFELRIEGKTTKARSFILSLDTWQKIQYEAGAAGETPVMQIEFQGAMGMNRKLAVIDWAMFEHYLRVVRDFDKACEGD
jgi:hypothetical protein